MGKRKREKATENDGGMKVGRFLNDAIMNRTFEKAWPFRCQIWGQVEKEKKKKTGNNGRDGTFDVISQKSYREKDWDSWNPEMIKNCQRWDCRGIGESFVIVLVILGDWGNVKERKSRSERPPWETLYSSVQALYKDEVWWGRITLFPISLWLIRLRSSWIFLSSLATSICFYLPTHLVNISIPFLLPPRFFQIKSSNWRVPKTILLPPIKKAKSRPS